MQKQLPILPLIFFLFQFTETPAHFGTYRSSSPSHHPLPGKHCCRFKHLVSLLTPLRTFGRIVLPLLSPPPPTQKQLPVLTPGYFIETSEHFGTYRSSPPSPTPSHGKKLLPVLTPSQFTETSAHFGTYRSSSPPPYHAKTAADFITWSVY